MCCRDGCRKYRPGKESLRESYLERQLWSEEMLMSGVDTEGSKRIEMLEAQPKETELSRDGEVWVLVRN
jgi:hypothetical protein